MRTILATKVFGLLLFIFLAGNLSAQEKSTDKQKCTATEEPGNKPTSNTEFLVDFTSNYVWRDWIYGFAAFQPSVNYNFGTTGFSLNVWSSFGADYETNDLEVIPTLSYSFSVKEVDLSVGAIYYTAPGELNSDENTNYTELMASAGLSEILFKPSLEVYYDLNGPVYASFSADQDILRIYKSYINFYTSVGFRENSEDNDNGFRDLNMALSYPFEFKYADISCMLKLTHIPDLEKTEFQAGVSVLLK